MIVSAVVVDISLVSYACAAIGVKTIHPLDISCQCALCTNDNSPFPKCWALDRCQSLFDASFHTARLMQYAITLH